VAPAVEQALRGRRERHGGRLGTVVEQEQRLPAPEEGFQGEGLLAVDPGDGSRVRVFSAPDPARSVASIRARLAGDRMIVTADEPVQEAAADGLAAGLAAWADGLGARAGVRQGEALGPVWCSWYCYWRAVTAADVAENLEAIDALGLDVAVVQVDDGWQRGIGDWHGVEERFGDLAGLVRRIRASGRRAGIWLAPLMVGEDSALALEHPDWLVRGADAGLNWDQPLRALDVTHPAAAEALQAAVRWLAGLGFDYFKIDFLYAGAMEGGRHQDAGGLDAYREGLRLIREAAGPEATLLGCGAPLLPSVASGPAASRISRRPSR
jgi:alpha-galactosidase